MTLEPTDAASPDDLIQYGRDDVLTRLEELAEAEAKLGDCRAKNSLRRLIELAGFRRKG